jgi:glutaredoxin 3
MNLVMYTRTNPPCPFCQQAKALAKAKGIDYTNIDIGTDISREEFQNKFPSARTVPLILIDGEVIGGFNEFKNYILSKSIGDLSL